MSIRGRFSQPKDASHCGGIPRIRRTEVYLHFSLLIHCSFMLMLTHAWTHAHMDSNATHYFPDTRTWNEQLPPSIHPSIYSSVHAALHIVCFFSLSISTVPNDFIFMFFHWRRINCVWALKTKPTNKKYWIIVLSIHVSHVCVFSFFFLFLLRFFCVCVYTSPWTVQLGVSVWELWAVKLVPMDDFLHISFGQCQVVRLKKAACSRATRYLTLQW